MPGVHIAAGTTIMNRRIIIALLALTTAFAVPVAAQAQYRDWRAPTFPWMKRFKPVNGPTNQAAMNGDAAIRYQETINAYAHK